ncbi:MAG: T9SS type A sorting domain-containing protein, partial [Ferruginibacter sp.]
NMVNWTSLAEDDGDYFEIERSMDGQSYVKIATIAGRYKTGGNYQFKDERPATGINYYRLKIITKNGNSSYSKVVNLRVKEGSFVLETYPNPVTNLLTVTSSGMVHGAARLSIMDASGKLVRSLPHTGSKTVIPIQGLAAGYYLLHYQDDVTNENRKIVKK